jgi:hypothetical protein
MGIVASVTEAVQLMSPVCAGLRRGIKGTTVNAQLVEERELFTIAHPLFEKWDWNWLVPTKFCLPQILK